MDISTHNLSSLNVNGNSLTIINFIRSGKLMNDLLCEIVTLRLYV